MSKKMKRQVRSFKVVVVMGSRSDLGVMKQATDLLTEWGVFVETKIVSAHRTPALLAASVMEWQKKDVKIIIAGAGGAAHLPGMLASMSYLPVIGVPIKSSAMGGLDSLLSIAQMPRGVPVASVAVDNATNAALLALQILGLQESDEGMALRKKMILYKNKMRIMVEKQQSQMKRIGLQRFLALK